MNASEHTPSDLVGILAELTGYRAPDADADVEDCDGPDDPSYSESDLDYFADRAEDREYGGRD